MAVDTPARIAILGAGPIGLEAGLYGRFLGYDVDIYEQGRVCENLFAWGHIPLFTPLGMNRSRLGLAAIAAQLPDHPPAPDDRIVTGRELAAQYFLPLAQTDLLAGHIYEHCHVTHVGRTATLKGELVGDPARGEQGFRILTRRADGSERVGEADVVIDATGTYPNHNWAGQGGVPALGEHQARERQTIAYHMPDVHGSEAERYAGKHTLVVGAGYSAATTIVELARLAAEAPDTQITWVARNRQDDSSEGPIVRFPNDPLPERDALAQAANRLATAGSPVTYLPDASLAAIEPAPDSNRQRVRLTGVEPAAVEVDQIVANVGYRPDFGLASELQLHTCYATDGPMRLAAALAGQTSADCLAQTGQGSESLLNPEPNFYVLGSKSYGRGAQFLLSIGREQIRDLFAMLVGRSNLNLYETI